MERHQLTSEATLRDIIPPSGISAHKVLEHIDEHCRRFLEHATFALIATWDIEGHAHISPKGRPAGLHRDHR